MATANAPAAPSLLPARSHSDVVSLVVRVSNLEQFALSTPATKASHAYISLLNDFVSIADRLCPGAWRFACDNAVLGYCTGVVPNQPDTNALGMLMFFVQLRQEVSKVRRVCEQSSCAQHLLPSAQLALPNGQPLELSGFMHQEPSAHSGILGTRMLFSVTGPATLIPMACIYAVQPGELLVRRAARMMYTLSTLDCRQQMRQYKPLAAGRGGLRATRCTSWMPL